MKTTYGMGRPYDKNVLNLRAREIVEVRSQSEILATLDTTGRLDGLPFMPEMLQHCGERFRVYKRADKTCDTIGKTGSRRMENAVHLEGVRCDGAAHGGCQAGCLIFWKEVWLKQVANCSDGARIAEEAKTLEEKSPMPPQGKSVACTKDTLFKATRRGSEATNWEDEIFSCQATELPKATSYLAWWDVRQYIRDVRSDNISLRQLLRGATIAAFNMTIRNIRRGALAIKDLMRLPSIIDAVAPPAYPPAIVPTLENSSNRNGIEGKAKAFLDELLVEYPHIQGKIKKTPSNLLNLQSGELVTVKSKEEILKTLDTNNKNRGLLFDVEMLPYCGKTFRVLRRVEQIVNEKTGTMMHMPNDCVILDGVICGGCLSKNRRFCPRGIYPYWREIWLKRLGESEKT